MTGEAPAPGERAPHVIRLRGPWTDEAGRRVKLPAAWRDALGDAESAVLRRRFNRPTNLDAGEAVRLLVESPQRIEALLLNTSPVASGDDLAAKLADSNELTVRLARAEPGGVVLEARLEIG
ncbi:MAG: hypothetical protein AAF790_04450 [Planctomycetota bacterium]